MDFAREREGKWLGRQNYCVECRRPETQEGQQMWPLRVVDGRCVVWGENLDGGCVVRCSRRKRAHSKWIALLRRWRMLE